MAQVIIDVNMKQMAIVLKHAEDNSLRFEDAFLDIIESHDDLRKQTIAATLKAVADSIDVANSKGKSVQVQPAEVSPSRGKSVVVPANEETVSIKEVYAMATAMPMHKPFTVFDVIEMMPNAKVLNITEDQMRGWGTPFSNWVKRNAAQFQVIEGNHNPRQYMRIS